MQLQNGKTKKFNWPLAIVFLVVFFVLRYVLFQEDTESTTANGLPAYTETYFTKHAKERMTCRGITEAEVAEVLAGGVINNSKSEMAETPCKSKYAIEKVTTQDKQRLRIIVAPCDDKLHIVTAIDLENEYDCE